MPNDVYEKLWSPFDPEWYQQAFDKFISTADQLFNQNEIISQGFQLPDADGSMSSVFRKDAVLNNSFNEELLRDTLRDIYTNSSHKLVASNHDNTHFFKWSGSMKDVAFIPNTNLCEIVLPTDTFVFDKTRDKFKLSQFYRKWIDITDILQHWDVFKWNCMLFINQRIYSEYQLKIDDHQVTIRFKYQEFWTKQDYPIYVYKFDTNAQTRIKITRELVNNQWNWKVPIDYFTDNRFINSGKIIVAFNKIADLSMRKDGITTIDPLGDSLEFLKVENGYIDLSNISQFNKELILSESDEWLWMSVIVPKFLHEFPILLPTDIIYRPYQANYVPVFTSNNGSNNQVYMSKSVVSENKKLYVNLGDEPEEWTDGWMYTVRPIVLADAFENNDTDPYEKISHEVSALRDLITTGADMVEEFRMFLLGNPTNEKFDEFIVKLENTITEIKAKHDSFLKERRIEDNSEYNTRYNEFIQVLKSISKDKMNSAWFNKQHGKLNDFWSFISPLIHIPRALVDKYYVSIIVKHIGSPTVWENTIGMDNKHRFRRPIDSSDFWTFEYDMETNTWKPYEMDIKRHFPDVYLLTDPKESYPTPNRVFKAFFFYSDTINTVDKSGEIIKPTVEWDKDIKEYEFKDGGVYRDIFMEKFYWMGVRSIYKGIITTKYRWEVIEYIKDNSSYERFNKLFLNTMDPYFKMGLATYLKSDQFEFPFDHAIEKMNERINQDYLGYKRVTNFEMYLNKTWIPSYFDYITKIMDGWDWSSRLIRRPRDSFDTRRLLPVINKTIKDIENLSREVLSEIKWVKDEIKNNELESINANLDTLEKLINDKIKSIKAVYDAINSLDIEIYSIEDINNIILLLEDYTSYLPKISDQYQVLQQTNPSNGNFNRKLLLIEENSNSIKNEFYNCVFEMGRNIQSFNIEEFMKAINDPEYFDARNHEKDFSLIGKINQFEHIWPENVQKTRNALYASTTKLWAHFNPNKSYTPEESRILFSIIKSIKSDLTNLNISIKQYWDDSRRVDHEIDSLIEFSMEKISLLETSMENYLSQLTRYQSISEEIGRNMILSNHIGLSKYEKSIKEYIDSSMYKILQELSFFAGKNNHTKALELHKNILLQNTRWIDYIKSEIKTVSRLGSLVSSPVLYIERITQINGFMLAMIEYMKTVDREFIPIKQKNKYSNIFSIDEVDLISNGFNHTVGDLVFIPSLGVFKIDTVAEDISKATAISKMNYRSTIFDDPSVNKNPFDTVTNGNGIGISVRAIRSTRTPIIDDSAVSRFVNRVANLKYLIRRDINIINPHNNKLVEDTIKSIKSIKNDWTHITNIFLEHMTSEVVEKCTNLINRTSEMQTSLEGLVEARGRNEFNQFMVLLESFIIKSYESFESIRQISPTYIYFDNRLRVVYKKCTDFYGNGTTWNDAVQLTTLLENVVYELKLFERKILKDAKGRLKNFNKLKEQYDGLFQSMENIKESIVLTNNAQTEVESSLLRLEEALNEMPSEYHKDVWFHLNNILVGSGGTGYSVGDVVEIIPELPTNPSGEVIRDQEDIIMNDILLVIVTNVDEKGSVTEAQPLLDYAIPYVVWGVRNTRTRVGKGTGLIITAYSYEISLENTDLFLDPKSDLPLENQFDKNDLVAFKFENIHDLNMTYEVFYAGKQIRDFIVRHEKNNHLKPSDVDTVYLKANDVMNLLNASNSIKGEHYFVYKLDDIKIIDPGAGYSEGQEILVETDQVTLRLKVAKLTDDTTKGIAKIDLLSNQTVFNGVNPASNNAKVVSDTLNNIDDEFHNSYYDLITSEGITKPAVHGFDQSRYPFTSKRFDKLPDGDRNKVFMYPDVNQIRKDGAALNGDPDGHWYLGSRIDNEKFYNGISNTINPTDPFIPDENRVPVNKPLKGEYQEITSLRIHNSEREKLESLTKDHIVKLVNNTIEADEPGPFRLRGDEIVGIPDSDVETMVIGGDFIPQGTPMVEVDGELIKAVDFSRVRDLIYGNIEGTPNPGPFVDTAIVNIDPTDIDERTLMNQGMVNSDLTVPSFASLPKHINEWKEATIGKVVIVERDETNANHRMLYRLRTFLISGYLVYDAPEVADYSWNYFDIDWMKIDSYPDLPTMKAQYPSADWRKSKSYRDIQRSITDGKVRREVTPRVHQGTFISNITVDDISVYNLTTNEWEDLHDTSRWRLETRNDIQNNDYGFRLTYLEPGFYDYNMRLYLNKIPETQMKNAQLKRDARFEIISSIVKEVSINKTNHSINTGRHLRIRKLFPYEQTETFTIGGNNELGQPNGYEMNFKLANYMHFRNQIHLEDIKIYNKTAGRFENLLDPNMFEVRFKDDKAVSRGFETQTKITQSMIASPGESFSDGHVWGYNEEYNIHIFGEVTADYMNDGHITTFTPIRCPKPPKEDISIEFKIYQYKEQKESQAATVIVEFQTQKVEVWGDGYHHNVKNPMAPVPREFKIICQYDLTEPTQYDVIISLTPKSWTFIEPRYMVFPTFTLPKVNIQHDRLYVMTDKGRFPLINPSTGKPSMNVTQKENSTEVQFLNLYNKYEHLEIHSTPYPMRSVYTQRRVPKHGYINLEGKINKPLNKKYFEFWMNGRLLHDEVTIITPTKIFLHGLKSLRNFEIIEINRDPNEYFSDNFLTVEKSKYGRPFPHWNYKTYLDDALSGTLKGDNYTPEEQEYLLTPVWKQVERDHPEYKNYPPNQDIEKDILLRIDENTNIGDIDIPAYQFLVLDVPTIEGVPITGRGLTFSELGFLPISSPMIIDMLNEEWKEEIKSGKIRNHSEISTNEWYGFSTRMYDKYGVLVHDLNEAAYKVTDNNLLRINADTKISRIVKRNVSFDLD